MYKLRIFKIGHLDFIILFTVLFTIGTLVSILLDSFFFAVEKYTGNLSNKIEIIPDSFDISILKIDKPSFLGKGSLSEKDLDKIKNLIDCDSCIQPVYVLKSPAHLSGQFAGITYGTDLAVFGMNIGNDNPKEIYCSSNILDFYNLGFSSSGDLPKLNDKLIKDLNLKLILGSNSFKQKSEMKKVDVKIKELRNDVELLGITMNYQALKKISASINAKLVLTKIVLSPNSENQFAKWSEVIDKNGYKINGSNDSLIKIIKNNRGKIQLLFQIPSFFLFLIILLYHNRGILYFIERNRKSIIVLKALGFSNADIFKMLINNLKFGFIVSIILSLSISIVIIFSVPFDNIFSQQIISSISLLRIVLIYMIVICITYFHLYLNITISLKKFNPSELNS